MNQANAIFATQTKPNLHKVQELLGKVRNEVRTAVLARNETAMSVSRETKTMLTIIGVGALAVGVFLAWLIARGIVRALTKTAIGLNEGADQVNDAAAQVSAASQQLAEGASEQASALEETSSALEQMAAQTRANADNSMQANSLSEKARQAADAGGVTVRQLNDAMRGISNASEQISKIIKVIEEIAFQTNLLALNAAVEAARAGEHGKGFAVVADEVRNLAQRAAAAAKEITDLIGNANQRSQEGVRIAGEVGKSFDGILSDVRGVSDLIKGIAQASQEQAQGVEQVNTAVSQMDKVTQQNAAGAEESASAAEELAAQAASVKAMVRDLVALVGGKAARQLDSTAELATEQRKPGRHFAKLTERLAHRGKPPVQRESGEAMPRSGGVAGLEQVEAGSRPGANAPDGRGESGADLDSF